MNVDAWLAAALADADRRGLPELKPLLEALAHATVALRGAPWNEDAAADRAANRMPAHPGGRAHDPAPTHAHPASGIPDPEE